MSKFNEKFIENYDEDSAKIDVEYLKRLHNFHNNLPFLSEIIKIKKCNKLECNLYELWCIYNNFKTSIKSWINTKKMHKVIKLNQKTWLKPFYIDMNTKLRTEARIHF